ncbi:YcxB family protein [Litorilituus lipolyticus]|uniref:YcxB family protein n=1 Tax=Litorilituus lipolyticus TaxID=2491017 RepID=A0A502L5S9_9GAMM|nr:YcxB family protein [Litorilituus lipolyticus]TPH18474.1 YcxB family protein [Litorilituus lipolyticus]
MADTHSFTSSFVLDKAHFTECYTQSSTVEHNRKTYFKANILTVFGLFILLFTPVNGYAAWFVISLGLLESLSIYYHQPWWVFRQMLSKAANSEVTITIDDDGVLTESFYDKRKILWLDVNQIKATELGYVIFFSVGKNISRSYLSKATLSAQAQTLIESQAGFVSAD